MSELIFLCEMGFLSAPHSLWFSLLSRSGWRCVIHAVLSVVPADHADLRGWVGHSDSWSCLFLCSPSFIHLFFMTPSSAWMGPLSPPGDRDPGEDGSELNGERREWCTQVTGSFGTWVSNSLAYWSVTESSQFISEKACSLSMAWLNPAPFLPQDCFVTNASSCGVQW